MFAALLALGPVYLTCLTLGFLTVFFAVRRLLTDRRIYKAGGVRSNVMATNPLTGKDTAYPMTDIISHDQHHIPC